MQCAHTVVVYSVKQALSAQSLHTVNVLYTGDKRPDEIVRGAGNRLTITRNFVARECRIFRANLRRDFVRLSQTTEISQ